MRASLCLRVGEVDDRPLCGEDREVTFEFSDLCDGRWGCDPTRGFVVMIAPCRGRLLRL